VPRTYLWDTRSSSIFVVIQYGRDRPARYLVFT
jgi:hypothetical protein